MADMNEIIEVDVLAVEAVKETRPGDNGKTTVYGLDAYREFLPALEPEAAEAISFREAVAENPGLAAMLRLDGRTGRKWSHSLYLAAIVAVFAVLLYLGDWNIVRKAKEIVETEKAAGAAPAPTPEETEDSWLPSWDEMKSWLPW